MLALMRRRRSGPRLVLRLDARHGARRARSRCCRPRCSATASSNLGARHPERPVAAADWGRRSSSPAYLQVVRGYDAIQTGVIFTAATVGHAGLLAGRRAAREALRPADPDPGRLRHHDRRHRASCSPWSSGSPERLGVRPRPAPDRARPRRDAHPVGQRRAVQLRREPHRARSPGCRAASPTSARLSAPRSPAPSSSPASPRPQAFLRPRHDRVGGDRPGRAGSRGIPARRPCAIGRCAATAAEPAPASRDGLSLPPGGGQRFVAGAFHGGERGPGTALVT